VSLDQRTPQLWDQNTAVNLYVSQLSKPKTEMQAEAEKGEFGEIYHLDLFR
jgi:hypothetical protein